MKDWGWREGRRAEEQCRSPAFRLGVQVKRVLQLGVKWWESEALGLIQVCRWGRERQQHPLNERAGWDSVFGGGKNSKSVGKACNSDGVHVNTWILPFIYYHMKHSPRWVGLFLLEVSILNNAAIFLASMSWRGEIGSQWKVKLLCLLGPCLFSSCLYYRH